LAKTIQLIFKKISKTNQNNYGYKLKKYSVLHQFI
jgi:hypothetical protein